MNTPSHFASALPSERDLRLIRRKAARLRADHLRSLLGRLAAFLTGRTAEVSLHRLAPHRLAPHRLDGGRAAG